MMNFKVKVTEVEARRASQYELLDGSPAKPLPANPGDYILRGTDGREYPLEPAVFEALFDTEVKAAPAEKSKARATKAVEPPPEKPKAAEKSVFTPKKKSVFGDFRGDR